MGVTSKELVKNYRTQSLKNKSWRIAKSRPNILLPVRPPSIEKLQESDVVAPVQKIMNILRSKSGTTKDLLENYRSTKVLEQRDIKIRKESNS
jgi:hypothetical protein